MRRFISLLIVAVLSHLLIANVAGAQSVSVCGNWIDVDSSIDGFDDMVNVCQLGWIRGGGGYLNVDKNLKRIEMVAVVNRVLGVDRYNISGESAFEILEDRFSDFDEYDQDRDWMYVALDTGVKQVANFDERFWKGYEDGTFRMLNDVTYAEFLKQILFSFEKMEKLNGNFRSPEYSGGAWFSSYFEFLEEKGVFEFEGDEFEFLGESKSVHEKVTRGDAIELISFILKRDVYTEGKIYGVEDFEIEIPYFMSEVSDQNEDLWMWKDTQFDSRMKLVKLLDNVAVELPSDFVSIYVPNRLSTRVSRLYRTDRCSSDDCVRAYWFVMNDGERMLLEGSFDIEKTDLGRRSVDNVMNSIEFVD